MSKDKAKQWVGILISFQEAGYISLASFMALSNNVARNFGLSSNDMNKIINNAHRTYDNSISEANVSVTWKTKSPTDKATLWAGIITTMQKEGYISPYGLITLAENVALKFNLKWKDMSQLIDYAHKNVNFEKSYAYADIYWK
jgi:ribosomal protein S8